MSDQEYSESYNSTDSENNSSYTGEDSFTSSSPQSSISIYTPIIYVGVLLTALIIFSIYYRKKKIQKLTSMKSLFSENYAKDMYLQLKSQTDPKVNDKVLKAALIRRGAEAIRRMIKLKETQPFVTALYVKGSIGDDAHERFKIENKLQQLELNELGAEAESLKQGWAQFFFPVCQEVTMNEALRRRLNSMGDRKEVLSKEWINEVEKIEKKVIKAAAKKEVKKSGKK